MTHSPPRPSDRSEPDAMADQITIAVLIEFFSAWGLTDEAFARAYATISRTNAFGDSMTQKPPYCTDPGHQYGDHDQSCLPPADPGNPELRLLRAIYGLCPDHDACTPADHPEEGDADGPGPVRDL